MVPARFVRETGTCEPLKLASKLGKDVLYTCNDDNKLGTTFAQTAEGYKLLFCDGKQFLQIPLVSEFPDGKFQPEVARFAFPFSSRQFPYCGGSYPKLDILQGNFRR
eukprot:gene6925-9556_t